MVRDLRAEAFDRLIGQSARFYSDSSTGDLMSRLVADVELIQGAFGTRIADLFQGILTIAVMLIYVILLNPMLTLFALVVAPLLLLPIVEFSKRLRRTTFSSRERMGEIGEILEETIRGHRIVKTYGMEPFESATVSRPRIRRTSACRDDRADSGDLVSADGNPLGHGPDVPFPLLGAKDRGRADDDRRLPVVPDRAPDDVRPIKNVTKVNLTLQQAMSSAARIFELMDRPNDIREAPGAAGARALRRGDPVRGRHVSATGTKTCSKGITLEIREGKTVALVGPSGGGKTSLVNLLPRLYDPTGGRDHDRRKRHPRSVTLAIASRPDRPRHAGEVLFNGTARTNIAYGREARRTPPRSRPRRGPPGRTSSCEPSRRATTDRSARTPGASRAASGSACRSRARSSRTRRS